jgi:hypothetical protein
MSPAEAAAALPPTFQILTGLTFAALLIIRFMAPAMLRPLSGKLFAFSVVFLALGQFCLSQATAKDSIGIGAEFFTFAGASFFVSSLLVVAGFILAARSAKVALHD